MLEELRQFIKSYSSTIEWVEFDKLHVNAPAPAVCIREISGRIDESMCNAKRTSQISLLCKVPERTTIWRKFIQGLALYLNNEDSGPITITQISTVTGIEDNEKDEFYYEIGFTCTASNSLDML